MAQGDIKVFQEDVSGYYEEVILTEGITLNELRRLNIAREVTDDDDFEADDIGNMVVANKASSLTLTIPEAMMVKGDRIPVLPIGAGQVIITVANTDAMYLNDACKTPGQYMPVEIHCIDDTPDAEVYLLYGGTL